MTNIILCGGSGTRLWPISRTLMPKQFVKLFDNKSLFQLNAQLNKSVCTSQFIVSNIEQYFLASEQLDELNILNNKYLLEPVGRNTAPAIALTCFALEYDELVLVTASDHLIKNKKEYLKVVESAKKLAMQGNLVTFGIKPSFPETGYGYIESNGQSVKAFHEKPDFATATQYLKNGNYFWNSGIFCFKAGVFLDELKKYSYDIYETSKKAYSHAKKSEQIRVLYEDMNKIPPNSIDYAVMEKSSIVKVVPSDIGWSDLGSFDALYNELPKDENQNTKATNHINIGSKNNLILTNDRMVVTIDIEDTIIVDTGDALLVSKKGSSQKVKQIVSKIKENESTYIKSEDKHRLSNETEKLLTIIEAQVGSYLGEDDIVRYEDDYSRI